MCQMLKIKLTTHTRRSLPNYILLLFHHQQNHNLNVLSSSAQKIIPFFSQTTTKGHHVPLINLSRFSFSSTTTGFNLGKTIVPVTRAFKRVEVHCGQLRKKARWALNDDPFGGLNKLHCRLPFVTIAGLVPVTLSGRIRKWGGFMNGLDRQFKCC